MIIFEGSSLVDDEPIVVIARPGTNEKTGWMLKVWILLRDVPPHEAIHDGRDVSICGDCKHRAPNRSCYVRVGLEPRSVWETYQRGNYPVKDDEQNWDLQFNYRYVGPLPVRLGAYGDPAAVPTSVWADLLRGVRRWTGYTHLWKAKACLECAGRGTFLQQSLLLGFYDVQCRKCRGTGRAASCDSELKRYCMASVDSPKERDEAQAAGWRTFHVVPFERSRSVPQRGLDPTGVVAANEINCPASKEAGKVTTCAHCFLCAGTECKSSKSIWIAAHGPWKENFA